MNNEKINKSTAHQQKRPLYITILSIWLMLNVFFSIAGLITPMRSEIYPSGIISLWGVVGVLYIILMLLAAVGYWLLKPWGVYTFALYIMLGLIQQLLFGLPPVLEQSMNRIGGKTGFITALSLLFAAFVLIPGYIYIIRPKSKNNTEV